MSDAPTSPESPDAVEVELVDQVRALAQALDGVYAVLARLPEGHRRTRWEADARVIKWTCDDLLGEVERTTGL
jgi:hypothetical protein